MLPEINLGSDDHMSLLLYGGKLTVKVREPVLDDKNNIVYIKSGPNKGQIKTHLVEKSIKIEGLKIKPSSKWKCKKDGFYKTNETILQEILKTTNNQETKEIINLILSLRGLDKEISTYYSGFQEVIEEDDCIRTQFQHVKTETGRLSSKSPNIQNISGSGESLIKQHFITRY